ncbi:PP2C family protein-serine/threonine phosphatase [Nocardia inohanensis]|uniref:PP2C family protein-serine/threonine phosphatase n=1 Tax=Nocardia inohanensis TaxID=209246 RepID=UPI000ADA88C4|nr:protein phosphatase 2C domain-containing protein [Nocardia inohanensis]
MSARCPACGALAAETENYCEACGHRLSTRRIALPPQPADIASSTEDSTLPELTAAPALATALSNAIPPFTGTTMAYDSGVTACEACGGRHFDADGYCADCGQLSVRRDRFEADLAATVLITDRGILHEHNEDSVAAAVLENSRTVVIAVCDGVSTSEDPQAASGAAARAGVDACLTALSMGRPDEEAVLAGLDAAAQAVRDIGTPEGKSPSCTYVSAIARLAADGGAQLTVVNIGDSRAYWLRPDFDDSTRLTRDDSLAQALVDTGVMDEDTAMDAPHAHVLTRWLGADSERKPWPADCVRSLRVTDPGVLLLCTDGMWNYLPEAAALARIATAYPALPAARALVDHALNAGGKDNISVALVPVPSPVQTGDAR